MQGKLGEAEALFREDLAGSRRVLGNDHPDTLASVYNMGLLLQGLGQLGEAEALLREAADTCRRVLGPEHPRAQGAAAVLAALLRARGKPAAAARGAKRG